MKYIDSWLTGLGLEKVIPRLKAQGITTPKLLATLTLKDMYEVVGIEDAEDRKKLYFLIQRLQTILHNKSGGNKDGEDDENALENDNSRNVQSTGTELAGAIKTPAVAGDDSTFYLGNRRESMLKQSQLQQQRRSSSVDVGGMGMRGGVSDSLSSVRMSASTDQSEEDLKVLRRRHQSITTATQQMNSHANANAMHANDRTTNDNDDHSNDDDKGYAGDVGGVGLRDRHGMPVKVAPSAAAVGAAVTRASVHAGAAKTTATTTTAPAIVTRGRTAAGSGQGAGLNHYRSSQSPTPTRGLGGGGGGIRSPIRSPRSGGACTTTANGRSPIRSPVRPPVDRSPIRSQVKSPVRSPVRGTVRSPVRSTAAGNSPIRSPVGRSPMGRNPLVPSGISSKGMGAGTAITGGGSRGVTLHIRDPKGAALLRGSITEETRTNAISPARNTRATQNNSQSNAQNNVNGRVTASQPVTSKITRQPSSSLHQPPPPPMHNHGQGGQSSGTRGYEDDDGDDGYYDVHGGDFHDDPEDVASPPASPPRHTPPRRGSVGGGGMMPTTSRPATASSVLSGRDNNYLQNHCNNNKMDDITSSSSSSSFGGYQQPSTNRPGTAPQQHGAEGNRRLSSVVSMPQLDGSHPAGGAPLDPYPHPRRGSMTSMTHNHDVVPIEDMAIRVIVRKRPISRTELARGDRDVMDIRVGGVVLVHEPKTKVDLTKIIDTSSFMFDDAFDAYETNEGIYSRTVSQLVSFVFDGGRASCFAYGQTGSGKTFTMMGSQPDLPSQDDENAGLYVLAARDIFAKLSQYVHRSLEVHVSCFEIYGGKLFDLLNDRQPVKCLEDAKQQVQLPGLSEHVVYGVGELLELMAKGHAQRSTGSTGANMESSRSHQIMQLVLREKSIIPTGAAMGPSAAGRRKVQAPPQPRIIGKLSFIDLAGSERGADTTHSSKQTRMEGAEINTSLLALKEVIRSLERKHGHTPFRGSKLTQVLKDSFVGDRSRCCMIACVSPSHSNCEHTLNTLRYADRVKEHQASTGGTGSGGGGAPVDAMELMDGSDLLPHQRPSRTSSSPSLVSPPPSINQIAAAAAAAIGVGSGGSGGGSGGRRTQSVSAAYPNNHNHVASSSSSSIAMIDRPLTADSHGGHAGHAINANAAGGISMRSSVVGQQQGQGLGQGQGRQPSAGAGAIGRQSLLLSRQSIQASSSSQQQQQPHASSSPPQKQSTIVPDATTNPSLPRGAVAGEHFSPSLKQQIGGNRASVVLSSKNSAEKNPMPFPGTPPTTEHTAALGRVSEDMYQSYDDNDEDEEQAFVRGGYFKQKKTVLSSASARSLPSAQRHHPLQPSRDVGEEGGLGRGVSPGLGRDDDQEGDMDQFTIEKKHYTPSHTPTSNSPPPEQPASSSSSSSISPKKSLSLHKMLATHHHCHIPGGSAISAVAHDIGIDYGLDENLLDDNFVSGVGVGRRSSTESRAKGPHSNHNHRHDHRQHPDSDMHVGGVGVRQSGSSLGDTLMMKRFLDLLTAHKQSIAETAERMKGMMIVIDKMENTSDRDSESYSNHLEHLLDLESNAIEVLQKEIHFFQAFRGGRK